MEWWRRAPSRPQDRCTTFQNELQGKFFFFLISLLGNLSISCFIESLVLHSHSFSKYIYIYIYIYILVLRHCHLVVIFSCWNFSLYNWSCCNFGHRAFLDCWVIWHGVTWTILMTHEIWQCMYFVVLLNVFWLDFWGHWSHKNLVCRLGWTNSFLMNVEILLEGVNFVS